MQAYETVYLLKWLFPPHDEAKAKLLRKAKFPRFTKEFESQFSSLDNYWKNFAQTDDQMQVDQVATQS